MKIDIHQKKISTLLWSLGASSSRSGSEEATKKRRRKKEPIMMIRPNDVSFPGVWQEQPSTQPIRKNLCGLAN